MRPTLPPCPATGVRSRGTISIRRSHETISYAATPAPARPASPSMPTARTRTGPVTAPGDRSSPRPARSATSAAAADAPASAPTDPAAALARSPPKRPVGAAAPPRLHDQSRVSEFPPRSLKLIERHHRANVRFTVDADRRAASSLITITFSAGRRAHAANSPNSITDARSHASPRSARNDQTASDHAHKPHRIRRTLNPGQPTQELVDDHNRTTIRPDHRPRLHPAGRHPAPDA